MNEVRSGTCCARLPTGGRPALATMSSAMARQTSNAPPMSRNARLMKPRSGRARASGGVGADDKRGDVVALRSAAAETLDRPDQSIEHSAGRQTLAAAPGLLQAVLAELAAASVERLGDAVAVEQQPVAGGEADLRLLVTSILERAEHDAAHAELLERAVLPPDERIVVAGVRIAQRAASRIHLAVEHRDELAGRDVPR